MLAVTSCGVTDEDLTEPDVLVILPLLMTQL